MEGGSLLSQGGYGCVFTPSINCQGIEHSKDFISKIQKNDFSARNEIFVGDLIKKNKNYNHFFAPVISSCPINISKIKTKGLDECSIITNNTHEESFIMMKIKFIAGSVLSSFITENKNSALVFSSFANIYLQLLKSIKILIQEKVVHFDLKGLNIVYDKINEKPIIIDFGLSIPIEKLLKTKEYYHYFYIYAPDYYIWPLEVHYLNYIENIEDDPTLDNIKSLVNDFVNSNSALNKLSHAFQEKYKKKSVSVLSQYLDKPSTEVKLDILKYWNTWDNYSISIMYLKYIDILFGNDPQIENNNYIKFMIKTMLQNIHPDPTKRIDITSNIRIMENFSSDPGSDNLNQFEELLKEISINKTQIDKKTLTNQKSMSRLTKKILSKR